MYLGTHLSQYPEREGGLSTCPNHLRVRCLTTRGNPFAPGLLKLLNLVNSKSANRLTHSFLLKPQKKLFSPMFSPPILLTKPSAPPLGICEYNKLSFQQQSSLIC